MTIDMTVEVRCSWTQTVSVNSPTYVLMVDVLVITGGGIAPPGTM